MLLFSLIAFGLSCSWYGYTVAEGKNYSCVVAIVCFIFADLVVEQIRELVIKEINKRRANDE